MKLVKIFVEKRTLQVEITMKNKLKKALGLDADSVTEKILAELPEEL